MASFTWLGIEHILGGLDHLLFVLGLALLATSRFGLLKTVTAFTVGHSVTLALAMLGFVNLPSGPVEIAIAASILVLALDLTKRRENRWFSVNSWPLAVGFGLLHGLGFAGALSEIGLPPDDIPLSLFAFNLGIEIGQIAFIVAVLLIAYVIKRLDQPVIQKLRLLPAYCIGILAVFWVLERGAGLAFGLV